MEQVVTSLKRVFFAFATMKLMQINQEGLFYLYTMQVLEFISNILYIHILLTMILFCQTSCVK